MIFVGKFISRRSQQNKLVYLAGAHDILTDLLDKNWMWISQSFFEIMDTDLYPSKNHTFLRYIVYR